MFREKRVHTEDGLTLRISAVKKEGTGDRPAASLDRPPRDARCPGGSWHHSSPPGSPVTLGALGGAGIPAHHAALGCTTLFSERLLSAFVCFSPAPREEDGSGAVSPEVKGYSPHIPKGDTQDSVPTSRLPPSDKG